MNRSSATLFLPAVVLLALAAAVYVKPWNHLSAGNGPTLPSSASTAQAEAQMATLVRGLQVGLIKHKTLISVRCTPAASWPHSFGGDPGDAFDCLATFTTTTQRWCALFDPAHAQLITDFQGPRMCEGPPNAMIEP